MLENGYIKLYRSLLDWEWYDDINTKVVFLHLVLTANWEPQKWHGLTIEKGEKVCSFAKLSEETGLSIKAVRTAIKHLEGTGEVARSAHANFSIISIKNYSKFQDGARSRANEGQAKGKPRANEGQQLKKEKESKNIRRERENAPARFFGVYENVPLSDAELAKWKSERPDDWDRYINRLSEHMESTGKTYKSYIATLRKWAREDDEKNPKPKFKELRMDEDDS